MLKDHAGNVRTVITDEKRRDDYPMATMETANATTQANEELIYAGLPQTRINKNTIAGYPTDPTTSPNDYVAKLQAITGSQKIGPSITLKVMKGDSINIRVSSWYKLGTSTPTTPPINTTLANIVSSLISGISGSAVVNTHGVTASQFNTAGSFTPDVTSFLNNQTNTNYNTAKPKAYLNWIYFDEQFNIVSSSSNAEQVGNDQQFKLHVQQTVATNCGFLYVYVSNETPNIPVYFDNLQVSHVRSPLLETSEYYSYGLKMANISYRAASTLTNRYGWNGGNEYEDEGELNYSNTFYRKYDAQIGRFTGVDMYAESYAEMTPYQFGANNPVMFNDPMGDRLQKGEDGQYHPDWYNDLMAGGSGAGGTYNGYGSSSGGGGSSGFGGGNNGNANSFSALNLIESLWGNTQKGKDKNFYNVKYEVFNVYYKNEFVGFVEKIFFDEYKSDKGKDVKGAQLILGFKSKSDKFTEFNWVQNVITTHISKEKKVSGEFVYRDGYYYYADYTAGNKPYYNPSWNDNMVNSGVVDKNSKYSFLANYTTVFTDSPWRPETEKNVYWLASLSLVANTKNRHETLTNFYYGFQTDGNSKLKLINFGQSASNPYWFTNYLLGLKF
jgi:RHS repeat-associated protein